MKNLLLFALALLVWMNDDVSQEETEEEEERAREENKEKRMDL